MTKTEKLFENFRMFLDSKKNVSVFGEKFVRPDLTDPNNSDIAYSLDRHKKVSQVQEKVRSKTFKWNEFKQIKDPQDMLRYNWDHGLQDFGCGSSRCVYVLTAKTALKVVQQRDQPIEAGIGQNKTEVKLSQDKNINNLLAKVLAYDKKNYFWVVSELVRPINIKDTAHIFGIDANFLMELIETIGERISKKKEVDIQTDVQKVKEAFAEEFPNLKEKPLYDFLNAVHNLIQNTDLMYYDLVVIEHWGKTPDGRIVLLDYGFDEEIATKIYGFSV